ncbi:MAG: 3-keto-disaccharide hydrolase [Verrucomicrobiales bacterium]
MKNNLKVVGLSVLLWGSSLAGAEEWVSLFDGETLAGWETGSGKPAKEGGWVAEDGVLHRKSGGGDLLSAKEYGDFELRWEWKISPKGNSGVKYRVKKFGTANLGPEYQILDNEHPDGKKTVKRQAASLYDLKAIDPKAELKPVGEWNQSRLVVKGNHFQHYLNGTLALEVKVGDEEWQEIFAKSKYRKTEGFAANATGKILLQDHQDPVWYRQIEIRELK